MGCPQTYIIHVPMNLSNRTIFEGDNLPILRGIDDETIDLIYLDPPFNSNKQYKAPIGFEAAGAAFKDSWTLTDLDDAWHGELAERHPALYAAISAAAFSHSKGMKAYLIMMGIRMLEMRRVLKLTGSIYLHCDPMASHYLKTVMDAVFGRDNFRNEVVWCYTTPSTPHIKQFVRCTNTILFYAKGKKWVFNKDDIRVPYKGGAPHGGQKWANDKESLKEWRQRKSIQGKVPENWWTIHKVGGKERTGYPTQKPLALLECIVKASSNQGDVVLDPFCGCATTCVAAEKLGRQWVGIDLSPKAVELVRMRLEKEVGILGNVRHRTDIPVRTQSDTPAQIHAETLFGMPSAIERALSQVELRQYRSYKHTLVGIQEGKGNGCETTLQNADIICV